MEAIYTLDSNETRQSPSGIFLLFVSEKLVLRAVLDDKWKTYARTSYPFLCNSATQGVPRTYIIFKVEGHIRQTTAILGSGDLGSFFCRKVSPKLKVNEEGRGCFFDQGVFFGTLGMCVTPWVSRPVTPYISSLHIYCNNYTVYCHDVAILIYGMTFSRLLILSDSALRLKGQVLSLRWGQRSGL